VKDAKGAVILEERRAPLVARVLGVAVVLVMGGVLLVWGVDLGQRIMGASQGQSLPDVQQQLDEAQAEIGRLTAERDALQAALKAAGVPLPAPDAAVPGAAAPGALVGAVPATAVPAAPVPAAPAPMAASSAAPGAASAPPAGRAASGTITALPPK
jgi:hypothetical protein